jgi:hypothetical protein
MIPVFFSELYANAKLADTFLNSGQQPIVKGKNISFYILENQLSVKVKAYFDYFFTALAIPTDALPTNYGQASFDGDSYESRYVSYPMIGLTTDNELVIRIGHTGKNDNEVGLDVPMVFKEDEYWLQYPDSKKSLKCELTSVVQNQGKPDEKTLYYITAKETKKPKYNFVIPFKIAEGVTPETLTEAWWSGKFHLCCTGFNKSGTNLTHSFKDALEEGFFPKEGVLLLLGNGVLEEFYDSKNDKTYISSKWKLIAASHPNILVNSYSEGLLPLGTIGQVSASQACAATKYILEMENNLGATDSNLVIPYYFLHISGVNQQGTKPRYDWIPKNMGFSKVQNLSPKVSRDFKMFISGLSKVLYELTASDYEAKQVSSIPGVGSTPPEDDENWDNKAF